MVVAGGLLQEATTDNCCWMQGRLFQLWQCVRDQTANREDCIFYFLFFCYFLPCFVLTWAIFFLFLYFLCLQFLGFPTKKEERRKRNLLIRQPQGSLSESRNSHCFDLTFTFSCGLPT